MVKYETPKIEVVEVGNFDVIQTSGNGLNNGGTSNGNDFSNGGPMVIG